MPCKQLLIPTPIPLIPKAVAERSHGRSTMEMRTPQPLNPTSLFLVKMMPPKPTMTRRVSMVAQQLRRRAIYWRTTLTLKAIRSQSHRSELGANKSQMQGFHQEQQSLENTERWPSNRMAHTVIKPRRQPPTNYLLAKQPLKPIHTQLQTVKPLMKELTAVKSQSQLRESMIRPQQLMTPQKLTKIARNNLKIT